MSVRPQLAHLTSQEVGLDPVVLRAHAKVWVRVNEAAAQDAKREARELDQATAQLRVAEARLFESELIALSSSVSPPMPKQVLSSALQDIERQLELRTSVADEVLRRDLRIWLYSLQGRLSEAGSLSIEASADPARSEYSWARELPLMSAGSILNETLERLATGESCARELYLLRAHQLAVGDDQLQAQYTRFADCLTQLMAQDHLSATPVSEPSEVKVSRKRKRSSPKLSGGYAAIMLHGTRALERGRVKQAKLYFKRASRLAPKNPDPVAQLGWCALARGQARASLKHFKTALSLRSDHADSLYGLGYAYNKLGIWDTARGHFKRYLKLYPRGAKVRIIENKLSKMPQ